jgi:LDH2 family malate/lactate/ureidoglycolate dehydrogenase
MAPDHPRYAIPELVRYATDLFTAAGMPTDRAAIVGALLVTADAWAMTPMV